MSDLRVVGVLLARTCGFLFRNWSVALKSAWLLIVPIALLIGWLLWAYKSGALLAYMPRHVGGSAQVPVLALTLAALAAFGTLPAAVNWHRFDILNETPAAVRPRLHLGRSFGYLWRFLLLMVIAILIAIPMAFGMALVADRGPQGFVFSAGALPEPPTVKNMILSSAFMALVTALIMRWSLILPASSVDRNMSLGEARTAAGSRLGFGGFLAIGLFFHLAPIVLNAIISELPMNQIGSLLLVPFILLFWFMFGIAFLTTLYEHCVSSPQPE